jgi:hypothetical protein
MATTTRPGDPSRAAAVSRSSDDPLHGTRGTYVRVDRFGRAPVMRGQSVVGQVQIDPSVVVARVGGPARRGGQRVVPGATATTILWGRWTARGGPEGGTGRSPADRDPLILGRPRGGRASEGFGAAQIR